MAQRNEGEDSRSAARDGNKRARAFVRTGRARKSARKTAAVLDTPERVEPRAAGIKAKSAARGDDPKLFEKAVPGQDPTPDSDLD